VTAKRRDSNRVATGVKTGSQSPVLQQIDKLMRAHPEGSKETRRSRRVTYRELAQHLRRYRIHHLRRWSHKHTFSLVHQWKQRGLTTNTIMGRLAHLRTLARWISKNQAVPGTEKFKLAPREMHRPIETDLATVEERIEQLRRLADTAKDPASRARLYRSYVMARLQAAAGLRTKEVHCWRPWADYDEQRSRMLVRKGTKGGRNRYVVVVTPELKEAIRLARDLVPPSARHRGQAASLTPVGTTFAEHRERYYADLRKVGLSRENALHPHAWRHGQAQALKAYLDSTGRYTALETAHTIARFLGHGRATIIKYYVPEAAGASAAIGGDGVGGAATDGDGASAAAAHGATEGSGGGEDAGGPHGDGDA